jgi:hypothetical protein
LALLELLRGASVDDSLQELEELLNHIAGPYELTGGFMQLYERQRDFDLPKSIKYLDKASKSAIEAKAVGSEPSCYHA